MAARLAGVPALDMVTIDFGDDERFVTEARQARALGLRGQAVHPPGPGGAGQRARSCRPPEETDWARRLLARSTRPAAPPSPSRARWSTRSWPPGPGPRGRRRRTPMTGSPRPRCGPHRPTSGPRRSRVGTWRWLEQERGLRFAAYEQLWRGRWTTSTASGRRSGVLRRPRLAAVRDGDRRPERMPGAEWFPGARLNYAERALATTGDGVAVVARSQTRGRAASSRGTSCATRSPAAAPASPGSGCRPGDRVVGYVPNGPEAVIAFLATASLGAVWASCPPEFGARSVIDRFGQLDPVVLLVTAGLPLRGQGRSTATTRSTPSSPPCPSVHAVVDVDTGWDDLLAETGRLAFEQVPFDHPLYVLFSSGTTGPPKAIVHGHGGILLEHLKALGLHQDLGPDDRFFWFTTTGWMMWNFLVSGLCVGSTIVLFDGDPGWPDLGTLWRMAAETGVTVFGVGAPFLLACRAAGLELDDAGGPLGHPVGGLDRRAAPGRGVRVGVRRSCPTCGSPRSAAAPTSAPPSSAAARWCRWSPARSAAGTSGPGSRRSTTPVSPSSATRASWSSPRRMPIMPLRFWGDDDGRRYRDAYFSRFPGVWCHGDWITDHRARLVHHHRALRRHPQPGRGAPRHERVLRRGRRRPRRARQPGDPPGGPRRRPRPTRCCSCRSTTRPRPRRRPGRPDPRRPALDPLAPPRARRDRRGAGHPPHPLGQEARGPGQADPARRAGRRTS